MFRRARSAGCERCSEMDFDRRETPMNSSRIFFTWTAAALALLLPMIGAMGQPQSLKEQLAGTWTLVSWELKKADGSKAQLYGTKPAGIAFFDTGGRYIITVMQSERPNYVSN